MKRIAESSPRFNARLAGVFYLLTFLVGALTPFLGGRLVVRGDAAATATNLIAHQPLFQLHFAADLIEIACYLAVTALFYDLFKPVSRNLSLVAALFSLMGCATQAAFTCLYDLAPLVLLGNAHYLKVFKVEQLQALAFLSIRLGAQSFNINLVFFGFYCVLIGYLVFRSTFLPPFLGALMAFGGLSWLTFLSPPLANYLSPYNLAPGILGEGSLTLWLLVMGVDVQRLKEQASVRFDSAASAQT